MATEQETRWEHRTIQEVEDADEHWVNVRLDDDSWVDLFRGYLSDYQPRVGDRISLKSYLDEGVWVNTDVVLGEIHVYGDHRAPQTS